MIKERPIIFSAPMVNAILRGDKTMTRRIVKIPQGFVVPTDHEFEIIALTDSCPVLHVKANVNIQPLHKFISCPYGRKGDRLWVRETCQISTTKDAVMYVDYGGKIAPDAPQDSENWAREWKTCPSIHMPRWASRITLQIESVRVERLQDISEEDAIAEGICKLPLQHGNAGGWYAADASKTELHARTAKRAFARLWQSINGPESWNENPFVWAISFQKIDTAKDMPWPLGLSGNTI